jgi:Domain of unknown function (DUF5916)
MIASKARTRVRAALYSPPHPSLLLILSLSLSFSLALRVPLSAQTARPPSLAITPLGDGAALHLDGVLDEPIWATADSIPTLTMTEPTEGGRTLGRTVVRVLANEHEIVVGVVAYDPDPGGIVSFSKARDPSLRSEDNVTIAFDSYLDGRSGYTFAVNPTGARYDALISGFGERQSANWDGIWEARTSVGARGWSAEIRIPIATLGFREDLSEWGFNIERRVQRLQEVSRWASPRRDYSVTQMSRAGRITGLPNFDLGIGVSVRPSFVAGAGVPAPDADLDTSFEPSLDVTQRVGANLLASVTANTDFAETEVDTRQTNLTRFALFFPEKRTFFLEGSDIFSFGFGLGRDFLAFHSRRLGLVRGEPVPIRVGAKLSGRAGNTNIGLLSLRTGSVDGIAPATTMTVARVQQNVFRESAVGVLAALGDPTGRADAWTAGLDLTYRTSNFLEDKNLILAGWGLANGRADLNGDRTAFGLAIDYPNDLFDIFTSYRRIGDAFDPSLGFVPRKAIKEYRTSMTWLPRPDWGWVRTLRHELFLTLVTDLDNRWESWRVFTAPINWRFESGDRVEINWAPQGERLDEPFQISDDVAIPTGSYHWNRYRIEAGLAEKRPVSGQVTWWFGDFYDGTLNQYEVEMRIKPSATFNLSVSGTRNVGELPEGRFVQELIGTRLNLNVSPDLQATAFVQYDNESKELGTNTRVRWTFDPLGELFVVYNHNIKDLGDRWRKQSNQFVVKVQYAVRR